MESQGSPERDLRQSIRRRGLVSASTQATSTKASDALGSEPKAPSASRLRGSRRAKARSIAREGGSMIGTASTAFGLTMPIRGVSSAGRAPALQAGGHRFDPGTLHFVFQGFPRTARHSTQLLPTPAPHSLPPS